MSKKGDEVTMTASISRNSSRNSPGRLFVFSMIPGTEMLRTCFTSWDLHDLDLSHCCVSPGGTWETWHLYDLHELVTHVGYDIMQGDLLHARGMVLLTHLQLDTLFG